jgi:hypothetical protein
MVHNSIQFDPDCIAVKVQALTHTVARSCGSALGRPGCRFSAELATGLFIIYQFAGHAFE